MTFDTWSEVQSGSGCCRSLLFFLFAQLAEQGASAKYSKVVMERSRFQCGSRDLLAEGAAFGVAWSLTSFATGSKVCFKTLGLSGTGEVQYTFAIFCIGLSQIAE